MTESLFLYSSTNVYKMAENVYPVNTNVTIDGRGTGTIIGHKSSTEGELYTVLIEFIKYDMLFFFSDRV